MLDMAIYLEITISIEKYRPARCDIPVNDVLSGGIATDLPHY